MGGKIALVPNPRDIDDLVDVIAAYQPTSFSGVPALFSAIAQHPRITSGKVSLRSLRFCSSGSAPLPSGVQEAIEQFMDVQVSEGFGMSEAPTATHLQPVKGEKRKGSIGLPLPDMDMRIVSLDDGVTDMPIGEIGELVMAGPLVMHGYHKMPTETANVLREKGGKTWLYTGDIARMDEDGYFYVLDRKKDMGIIGGFKVYPANVERVLQMHEAVMDTAVAAIPHPSKPGQEAVKAWVIFKQGMSASEEDLIEHCSSFLPPYEVPRRFAFVSDLPRSGVGKILRRELIQLELEDRKKVELVD
jgi:long-chain acyl-CoA synthetase